MQLYYGICVQVRGQHNFYELGLSLNSLYVGPEDQTQVVRLGGKHFSKEPSLAPGPGFKHRLTY